MWEFPGSNAVDTTMGDQSGIRGTTTRTLTFNRIRTSQAGVYLCRVTIDIQGLDSLSRTASQTVRVQSELLVYKMLLQLRQNQSLQYPVLCFQFFLTPLPTMEQT